MASMPSLEVAIRLIIIGQQLLIALVFLFGLGGRAARLSGAVLMLSLMGYVYMSDDRLGQSIAALVPLGTLLAVIVPYCLWLFARAIFEAPWPRPVFLYACLMTGLATWGVFLAGDNVSADIANIMSLVARVVSLLVVAHVVWLTLRGRPDDLVENRRAFRLFFVMVISLQVAAVLIAEILLGSSEPAGWLSLTNIVIIELLTVGLAVPLLRPNSDFFEPEQGSDAVRQEYEASGLGATERVYRQKLLDLMDDGYYRETGLTISMLAAELDYPEHQLRRLINGHLGYRNFSAFLNRYRIDEAKRQLADPEKARTPILTIALDLGYASLGPFNRAFKLQTGMTPSEFRRQ
ncbi:MAG: AraC family transcriptional regulator [Chromatiales bacterium]|nr:MAG: AraC family transcriptional regulator [Chromatiales bacterium]